MVKITVEMKPGDRMIHRSQQNNPQVSYTHTGEKNPPKASAASSSPLWDQKGLLQKLQKSSTHSRSWACPETSRQALQSLWENLTVRAPRSELEEKLEAPQRRQNKEFERVTFASNSVGEIKSLP